LSKRIHLLHDAKRKNLHHAVTTERVVHWMLFQVLEVAVQVIDLQGLTWCQVSRHLTLNVTCMLFTHANENESSVDVIVR
jgi:hypothetical protein